MTDDLAAEVAHAAVRAHRIALTEPGAADVPGWDEAGAGVHASYRAGVALVRQGLSEQDRHAAWVRWRLGEGWTLGAVKDDAARRHPWLVEWSELPEVARERGRLFGAVAAALT